MGYNTSVIVLNDALGEIENDPQFGKKIGQAIGKLTLRQSPRGVDIPSGNHCNAATVIETHHADDTTLLAFGGNCVSILGSSYGYNHQDTTLQLRLIEELADKLGYKLVKKSKSKGKK